jgi:hypothetical protein
MLPLVWSQCPLCCPKVGRPAKLSPQQQREVIRTVRDGSKTAADAARLFGRIAQNISRFLARANVEGT